MRVENVWTYIMKLVTIWAATAMRFPTGKGCCGETISIGLCCCRGSSGWIGTCCKLLTYKWMLEFEYILMLANLLLLSRRVGSRCPILIGLWYNLLLLLLISWLRTLLLGHWPWWLWWRLCHGRDSNGRHVWNRNSIARIGNKRHWSNIARHWILSWNWKNWCWSSERIKDGRRCWCGSTRLQIKHWSQNRWIIGSKMRRMRRRTNKRRYWWCRLQRSRLPCRIDDSCRSWRRDAGG